MSMVNYRKCDLDELRRLCSVANASDSSRVQLRVEVYDPPQVEEIGEGYGGDGGLYDVCAVIIGPMFGPRDGVWDFLASRDGGPTYIYSCAEEYEEEEAS